MSHRNRRFSLLVGTVALMCGLSACAADTATPAAINSSRDARGVVTLTVGSMFPATEILQYVQDTQAEAAGLSLSIREFSEYVVTNTSLADGSLDANLYQHLPYLKNFNSEHGTHLSVIGEVYFPALALYSKKIHNISELGEGASVSLPADPTNQLRALQLLEGSGIITLKPDARFVADIAENPKHLVFQELDAATLPRALDDVQAGIVNLTYALPAGLSASDQILTEAREGSPYVNQLATREADRNNPDIQKLYQLLTSEQTQQFILEKYRGMVLPAGPQTPEKSS